MNKQTLTQIGKSMWDEQDAVTSIEYALIASLIVVVIVGAVGLVGINTQALFASVSNCVEFAISGNGICS